MLTIVNKNFLYIKSFKLLLTCRGSSPEVPSQRRVFCGCAADFILYYIYHIYYIYICILLFWNECSTLVSLCPFVGHTHTKFPLRPCYTFISEAAVRRCYTKQVFLQISENTQEDTCSGVSFQKILTRCFPVNFATFLRAHFLQNTSRPLLLSFLQRLVSQQ